AMRVDADLLEARPVRRPVTGSTARRALRALRSSKIPYAVVGAAALAARGLPRMTKDLDVVVLVEDAFTALDALESAGFRSVAPLDRSGEPEMYVLQGGSGGEIDLLVAAGEPESTVV